MAQNQFTNPKNQHSQLHRRSVPQLPYAGQIYDPRSFQQQQHHPQQQQYQQYPQEYSIDARPQQRSYPVPQQPQQPYFKQPRLPPSPQPQVPTSLSFSQPPTQQYRPPPSPQPPAHSRFSNQPAPSAQLLQHQPHPFAARPQPSPRPQQYSPYAQLNGRPPLSPQSRTTPSPTREQTTASPRPRYAYLPQQSVIPAGGQPPAPGNNSSGRPLPTPRGRPESMPPPTRSPLPPPGSSIIRQPSVSPARSPLSPPVVSIPPSLRRPSMSSPSASPPKSSGPTRFSSRPNSPGHPSRPLPTPIPRSSKVQSLDMRNMNIRTRSPVKGYSSPMPSAREGQISPPAAESSSVPSGARKRIALPPAAAPGQPFVPHWKRNLPRSQIQVASPKHGVDGQRRGTVSAIVSTSDANKGVGLNRATTMSSGRPLPAFPVGTSQAHNGLTKSSPIDSGDNRSQARTPSPQYGILDLPRSRFITHAGEQLEQTENKASNETRRRSSTLPQVPNVGQSVTLQMASVSINDKGSRQFTASTFSDWPVNLPPLPRAPAIPSKNGIIDLDDAPPPSLRRTPSPSPSVQLAHSRAPSVPIRRTHEDTPQRVSKQKISFPADPQEFDPDSGYGNNGPMISISVADTSSPQISVTPTSSQVPSIFVGNEPPAVNSANSRAIIPTPPVRKGGGLSCGGCRGAIIGRIVSAMGVRWHPGCFRCCVCNELLENLSSYEKDGRPYCHLDYHEAYAPKCYHCHTTIVDEQFVTLDDHELGTRTYHEQHFFCAECGDPFLPPSSGNRRFAGDGAFEDDDVGFTVYKGHPYCESCHVRLRMPKCKKCKKSIRDGMKAVEALGGKWCWGCFVCAGCERPFENPSFFQRDNYPFCERCFSIMIKNEL